MEIRGIWGLKYSREPDNGHPGEQWLTTVSDPH